MTTKAGDDSSDGETDEYLHRRAILEPAILNVVNALGGYEGGVYRLGDEAYGCLKDLKRFWRKDDADDARTVARIFWAARVLPNDLVPILLETAGKGHVEDKRALACADLVAAMTWPIDIAEELKELDELRDEQDPAAGAEYTELRQSHLHYKAALLRPGVLRALLALAVPCLARASASAAGGRSGARAAERDVQVVSVVLHVVRNLAFIADAPANVHLSADQAELASLQSRLVRALDEAHFLELLLAAAAGAKEDAMFNAWNTLVLEIFYLLFRGIRPSSLVSEQAEQTKQNLRQLLTLEDRRRRDFARNAPSRHSRFGTTISVRLNPKKMAATTAARAASTAGAQQHSAAGDVIDLTKRQHKQKGKKEDEVTRRDDLSPEARTVLRGLARTFVESCFNRGGGAESKNVITACLFRAHAAFLASLLKDIKSERPKITEKDHLRLLFVTKWFLEYFLAVRTQEKEVGAPAASEPWAFGLVGEVIERGWIVWVLKRMNGAVEEKFSPVAYTRAAQPKLWTELQAGIECLTQLLALLEAMASSSNSDGADGSEELHEAAELLQQQLVYNGQVLDAALDALRAYKDGTQSLAFLRAGVHLAYAVMRMLEKWARTTGEGSYVRKRAKPKRKRPKAKGRNAEEPGVPDADVEAEEEGEEEGPHARAQHEGDVIDETIFTFESFELKFANSDITQSLLTYLGRYKEFTSPDEMKRIVSLLHRQVVRAKAEGLFFQVSALNLFKTVLADQKSFPKDQPYKDLVALINYILRQFFKAVEADSFVLIEVTKTSGADTAHTGTLPEEPKQMEKVLQLGTEPKSHNNGKDTASDPRFPPDVKVKKGYSWSEELAIAMAALQEAGQGELIEWVKETLAIVIAQRQRMVERASEAASDDEENGGGDGASAALDKAQVKISDYVIPYTTDSHANAATKNPQLKLMFRLVHCHVRDEDADELEWYIPAGIGITDLRRALAVIEQFEKAPLDLGGKRASQLLRKKRRNRRRTRQQRPRHTSADSDDAGEQQQQQQQDRRENSDDDDDDDVRPSKASKARAREREAYKSAQFIEDSDEEYGHDIDKFFEREAELRERTALAAVDSALGTGTMRATGTKKRRRPRGRPVADADADAADDDGAGARQAKRRAVRAGSVEQSESETTESGPEEVQCQVSATAPKPKPRPRYRGSVATTTTTAAAAAASGEPTMPITRSGSDGFLAPDDADVSSHDVGDQDRNESDAEDDDENTKNHHRVAGGGAVPNGSALPRKGRVIISDEEE
ncbi:timeless protein-domain-containing protein [Lactarius quietus]|nr:timeless protein-domain-containing protein [Lactarius quietus]